MFQVTNKCKTYNFATYFDTALLVEKTSSSETIAKNCGVQIPSTKVTPVFFLPLDQILYLNKMDKWQKIVEDWKKALVCAI